MCEREGGGGGGSLQILLFFFNCCRGLNRATISVRHMFSEPEKVLCLVGEPWYSRSLIPAPNTGGSLFPFHNPNSQLVILCTFLSIPPPPPHLSLSLSFARSHPAHPPPPPPPLSLHPYTHLCLTGKLASFIRSPQRNCTCGTRGKKLLAFEVLVQAAVWLGCGVTEVGVESSKGRIHTRWESAEGSL